MKPFPTEHPSASSARRSALASLLSGMGLVGLVLLLSVYVQHG